MHAPDHAEQERERYLSPEELARLGKALSQAEESGAAWQAVGCIKLLLATGLRKDEALSLKWSDVDVERRRLVLPETKTGRSVRPLSRPAIAILTGIRGRSSDSWLFPASRGAGHFVGLQKVWVQIRSAAGLGDVHLHDLRHTVGAAAASAGTSLVIVGRMLGHKKARSTERYAHVAPDVAADVADQIAEGIAHAVANGGVRGMNNLPTCLPICAALVWIGSRDFGATRRAVELRSDLEIAAAIMVADVDPVTRVVIEQQPDEEAKEVLILSRGEGPRRLLQRQLKIRRSQRIWGSRHWENGTDHPFRVATNENWIGQLCPR